ncbi:MAG: DUF4493 domain-containing protein [Rikenellaceae bacterium]
MKKLLYIAAVLFAISCNDTETGAEEPNIGYGRLAIETSTDNVITATTTRSDIYYLSEDLLPSDDELTLYVEGIYIDSDSGETMTFSQGYESLDAYNESEEVDGVMCPPYLPAGDYVFTITDSSDDTVESATNACFTGSSDVTIYARDYNATANITLKLRNSIIAIETTEWFDNYFAGGATLKLSTESGSEIIYDSTSSDEENNAILFVPASTTLYLEGEGTKQSPTEDPSDASTVTFTKSSIGTTTAGILSRVAVDAATAGGSKITITLDDTITDISYETIELNQ